jgi:uncharacterized protein (TIGR03086 family)
MDPIDRLPTMFEAAQTVMQRLPAEKLEEASGCHAWTVRQLLNHMIGTPILLTSAAKGEHLEPADFDPDVMADIPRFADDPLQAYELAVADALKVLTEPDVLERVCQMARGPVPIRQFVALVESDTLVHTCDLSRSVGIVPVFPEESIESADRFFRGFISPGARTGDHPHFAPPRDLSSGNALDRLLAFTGRQPIALSPGQ